MFAVTIVALAATAEVGQTSPLGDVAIVGAGASGVAMAKAFLQQGCRSLTVYEKGSSVGGHWAWKPNYVGVGVQNKRDAYRYTDMAMVGQGPRASAAEVVDYLRSYADAHGFSQNIRLHTEVLRIVEREQCGGRRRLITRNTITHEEATHDVDLVVLAPGIVPFLPPAAADVAFKGKVVHSSQLDEALVSEAIARGAQVVIVGGGKSASECVAGLREAGHPASLIRCVASSASTCALFEPQLWPHLVQRPFLALFAWSARLARSERALWQVLARLLRWPLFWFGLLVASPIGGGGPTLNGQVMNSRLMRLMRGVRATRGRMAGLEEGSVRCSDGQRLPADLVVCATGFRITVPPLYVEQADSSKGAGDGPRTQDEGEGVSTATHAGWRGRWRRCAIEEEQPLLFRSMVLPRTPYIAALLYNSMGINAMFSSELMAAWLVHFYASGRAECFRGMEEVMPDEAPLRELGGGEPFNTWHFDRSGEAAGGRGYASDFYEDQIYADLAMRPPSRDLALTRAQHDDAYYAEAAARFRALVESRRRGPEP